MFAAMTLGEMSKLVTSVKLAAAMTPARLELPQPSCNTRLSRRRYGCIIDRNTSESKNHSYVDLEPSVLYFSSQ